MVGIGGWKFISSLGVLGDSPFYPPYLSICFPSRFPLLESNPIDYPAKVLVKRVLSWCKKILQQKSNKKTAQQHKMLLKTLLVDSETSH